MNQREAIEVCRSKFKQDSFEKKPFGSFKALYLSLNFVE